MLEKKKLELDFLRGARERNLIDPNRARISFLNVNLMSIYRDNVMESSDQKISHLASACYRS